MATPQFHDATFDFLLQVKGHQLRSTFRATFKVGCIFYGFCWKTLREKYIQVNLCVIFCQSVLIEMMIYFTVLELRRIRSRSVRSCWLTTVICCSGRRLSVKNSRRRRSSENLEMWCVHRKVTILIAQYCISIREHCNIHTRCQKKLLTKCSFFWQRVCILQCSRMLINIAKEL